MHDEGRNEYIDLAEKANLLWNKILSKKVKPDPNKLKGLVLLLKIIIQAKTGFFSKARFFPNPIN